MYRIDDPSAVAALPTPEAAGSEGFFTEGNPGAGIPATLVRGSWLNMLQEELRAIVVAGGITPSKGVNNQVLSALTSLFGAAQFPASLGVSGWQKLPSGLILQWGRVISGSTGIVTTTFPIAFPTNFYGMEVTAFVGATNVTDSGAGTYKTATNTGATLVADKALVSTFNYLAVGN